MGPIYDLLATDSEPPSDSDSGRGNCHHSRGCRMTEREREITHERHIASDCDESAPPTLPLNNRDEEEEGGQGSPNPRQKWLRAWQREIMDDDSSRSMQYPCPTSLTMPTTGARAPRSAMRARGPTKTTRVFCAPPRRGRAKLSPRPRPEVLQGPPLPKISSPNARLTRHSIPSHRQGQGVWRRPTTGRSRRPQRTLSDFS